MGRFAAGTRCCLVAGCLVGSASPLAGQASPVRLDVPSEAGRRSLAGLDGVNISVVLTLDAEARQAGVSRESLLAFMESMLEDAGVPALADVPSAAAARSAALQLELGVTTLRAGEATLGWAYFLNLQLLQEVCIPGLPHESGCAPVPTWGARSSQPTVVPRDLSETVYGQLADAMRRFLRDYRASNPAARREDLVKSP